MTETKKMMRRMVPPLNGEYPILNKERRKIMDVAKQDGVTDCREVQTDEG